jgi:hypothetical protein
MLMLMVDLNASKRWTVAVGGIDIDQDASADQAEFGGQLRYHGLASAPGAHALVDGQWGRDDRFEQIISGMGVGHRWVWSPGLMLLVQGTLDGRHRTPLPGMDDADAGLVVEAVPRVAIGVSL